MCWDVDFINHVGNYSVFVLSHVFLICFCAACVWSCKCHGQAFENSKVYQQDGSQGLRKEGVGHHEQRREKQGEGQH